MDKHIYAKFVKRDDDKRIVTGYSSTEALDSQGEVVEKEAVSNALPAYLGEVDKRTGMHRYGNLREMHQLSAVGKTINAKVDDKGLWIEGKIVDDNAWKKVKEGVYAGFSIGGKVLNKVKNRIKALRLNEISLVDRPANPEAVFEMVKVDKSGKVTDLQKMPMADGLAPEEPREDSRQEIMLAGYILDLARNMRMLLNMFQQEGRSTKELSSALSMLKNLAVKVLNQEDKKKFDKVLYSIDFQELDKYLMKPKEVEEEKKMDIKKLVDNSWTVGYFENMKKVLG